MSRLLAYLEKQRGKTEIPLANTTHTEMELSLWMRKANHY